MSEQTNDEETTDPTPPPAPPAPLLPAVRAAVGQGCVFAQQVSMLLAQAKGWASLMRKVLDTPALIDDARLALSVDMATTADLARLIALADAVEQAAAADGGAIAGSVGVLAANVGNVR